jgi:hypothetical protein
VLFEKPTMDFFQKTLTQSHNLRNLHHPVYHPAAALYRRDWQPVLAADFQKIPKLIELIKQGQPARLL